MYHGHKSAVSLHGQYCSDQSFRRMNVHKARRRKVGKTHLHWAVGPLPMFVKELKCDHEGALTRGSFDIVIVEELLCFLPRH